MGERGKAFEKDRPTNKNNKQHMQHMSGKRRQGKGGDACPLKWNASGLFGPLLDPTATSLLLSIISFERNVESKASKTSPTFHMPLIS